MKGIIKTMGSFIAVGTAMAAGFWVWDNLLENKADKVVDKINNKFKKGEGA